MKFLLIILLALIGPAFCQELDEQVTEDTLKDTLEIVPKTKDTVYIYENENSKVGTYYDGYYDGKIQGEIDARENDSETSACVLTGLFGVLGAGGSYLYADQDKNVMCPYPDYYSSEYCLGYENGYNEAFKSIRKKQSCSGAQTGAVLLVFVSFILIALSRTQ